MHFSGHGLRNNKSDLGAQEAIARKKDGNLLVFEDLSGVALLIGNEMLKQILKSYSIKFKLVFVSSCHSEFIGEIFYNKGVGANHVICIKNEDTIADETSIIFAKSLYNALFMNPNFTIC